MCGRSRNRSAIVTAQITNPINCLGVLVPFLRPKAVTVAAINPHVNSEVVVAALAASAIHNNKQFSTTNNVTKILNEDCIALAMNGESGLFFSRVGDLSSDDTGAGIVII